MINKDFRYAVVGASNNEEKYGYTVFNDLIQWWYKVIAINPKEKEILWTKVYTTLSDYVGVIDVVIFVVPPKVTEMVLEEVRMLWIRNVWMQPWSESETAIAYCAQNWIACTHDACIMIQRKAK